MTAPRVDELRDRVAELIDENPSDIDPEANLFEQGLQSIALMRLVGRWRAAGLDIGFAELAEAPTLTAWARLLTRAGQVSADSGAPTAPASEPDEPDAEFDLALLQHAYWVGRAPGQRLGGVAPHIYLEFDGDGVDPTRLEAAFDRLVRRHDMLRAKSGDNGRQRIAPPAPWRRLRVHDLRGSGAVEAEEQLARIRTEMSHELLDIEDGEVFRAALSLLPAGGAGATPTRLHLDVDMIAVDAISYRVLLADLAWYYAEPATDLPPLEYSYREYLATRPQARRTTKQRAAEYWAARLPGLPGPPELPMAAAPGDRARAVRLAFFLNRAERAAITAATRRRGITPSVAMAATFAEVVGAWSAQPRFLLNVPLFDREQVHPDIDLVVGDFTESVLLEVDLSEEASFLDRAQAIQSRLHADTEHRHYSGVEVLRDLSRQAGDQVLAPVVFTSGLDLGELFDTRVRHCFGDPVWILSQSPQVVLDAQTSEIDGGILVNWDVRDNEFADDVPAGMFAAFTQLMRSLADDATWTRPIGNLVPASQREVRERVNDTARPDGAGLLHQGFFALAGERAGQAAVCWASGGALDHAGLAQRALCVAAGLHERGVAPGEPVAIALPRGPGQVVAALGVLAAGGTYVPVGVEQPAARAQRIASMSGHRLVIAERDGSAGAIEQVSLAALQSCVPLPAPAPIDPEQAAYLLFTSGSTGEPKGVEVPHRAAMATIEDLIRRLRLEPDDRTLMVSALDFDLSVFDIFAMLSVGGAVVVLDQDVQRDAQHWAQLIREHRVTVLNCVPALLDTLLHAGHDLGSSLRQVLLSGDRVGTDLPGRLRARVPGCGFAGLGGATEAAIYSTICAVDQVPDDWTYVPYGTPLDNVRLRVVDQLGRDAPDWVPGELWIGGDGVARGYRGDPDRTRDRFVEWAGLRWYRTGDLARYRPDGIVEFIGRRDNQVKINGYRIELGEVEAAALDVPGAEVAVAVVLGEATRTLAVAVRTDIRTDANAIGKGLAARLPMHMLPHVVVPIDQVPLTANGKVDRAAVGRFVAEAAGLDADWGYTAPSTPLERVVATVWESVLDQERIGVDRSLFAVGGDSVLATVIVSQLREALDTGDVSVRMLFSAPTIAGLATAMRQAATDPARLDAIAEIVAEVESMSEDEVSRELARQRGPA